MNINKVAILVKKAALEFDKGVNPTLAEYNLTAAQYKVLKLLYSMPSKTARVVDIEKYYSMTHPTTIGLLDTLEKKGFVSRMPNPDDARSRIISLTDKALLSRDKLENLGEDLEEWFTASLTKKEREQLVKLLQKLLSDFERE